MIPADVSSLQKNGGVHMAVELLNKEIQEFVIQSELLSGIKRSPDSPSTKNHLEIANILLRNPHRYVQVELINGALTRRTEAWLRSGTEGALEGVVPAGERIEELVAEFNADIDRAVASFDAQGASYEARERYAWERHDHLICMHAFKEGNGRTARLLLNHLRVLLGLSIYVIEYGDNKYFANLGRYRRKKFIPTVVRAVKEAA